MKIDVIGCGSAFSLQNNTSSIVIEDSKGYKWLIDCGPTIPRALWQRQTDINDIDVIYFTHIHPDHCSGLAVLLNQWKSFKRTKPLTLYCQPEQKAPLMALVALSTWPQTDLCFELHWQEITSKFVWQHWQIQTACTQHEVTNRAIRIDVDQQSLFYSGDGRPTPDTIALMTGATLAFQECASYAPLCEEASHGDLPACQKLLPHINVGALGLYHCYDELMPALRPAVAATRGLFLSADGLQVDLADLTTIEKLGADSSESRQPS